MNSGESNALFDIHNFVRNSRQTNRQHGHNGLILTLKCTYSPALSSILNRPVLKVVLELVPGYMEQLLETLTNLQRFISLEQLLNLLSLLKDIIFMLA